MTILLLADDASHAGWPGQLIRADIFGTALGHKRESARQRIAQSSGWDSSPMIAAGLKILLLTAIWEAQFQAAKWLFSRMRSNTETEKERAFRRCAPSYIVSYVHAFYLTYAGWKIVFELEGGGLRRQAWLYANENADFVNFVEISTLVFFCYVLYDLFHLILEYPDLGGVEMLIHHVGFLIASLLAYTWGAYPLVLGWLCTCETSTPILSTRWFVRQMKDMETTQPLLNAAAKGLGMKSRGVVAANRMEYWISIVFLAVFIGVRVLGYAWSLVGLGKVIFSGRRLDAFIPIPVRYVLWGLTLCGFVLNLIWVKKIVAIVFPEDKRKWLRSDVEHEQ